MIKYHPSDSDLVDFTNGVLSAKKSLLVSAHCDLCPMCKDKISALTEQFANEVFFGESKHQTIGRDYVMMFEAITKSDPNTQNLHQISDKCLDKYSNFATSNLPKLNIDGKEFSIPPTLQRMLGKTKDWNHLLGKLWHAPVDIGNDHAAQFIYIEKGGKVPEHTHKGAELTLVLDGEFDDGLSHYHTGDLICLNEAHTHTPESQHDDGCLVFSIIEKPLYFTKGWAKLINPLSDLFLKH